MQLSALALFFATTYAAAVDTEAVGGPWQVNNFGASHTPNSIVAVTSANIKIPNRALAHCEIQKDSGGGNGLARLYDEPCSRKDRDIKLSLYPLDNQDPDGKWVFAVKLGNDERSIYTPTSEREYPPDSGIYYQQTSGPTKFKLRRG